MNIGLNWFTYKFIVLGKSCNLYVLFLILKVRQSKMFSKEMGWISALCNPGAFRFVLINLNFVRGLADVSCVS